MLLYSLLKKKRLCVSFNIKSERKNGKNFLLKVEEEEKFTGYETAFRKFLNGKF